MCGIVAIQAFSGHVDESALGAALAALEHRGPDGAGRWLSDDKRVALGCRRLAIVAPYDGQQPLSSEDGQVQAVVNGELYDYADERERLRQRGHTFATSVDSEIALHLYEERGLEFVAALRGEFAAILWDRRRQLLVAARDRFGVKPLVWAEFHTPAGRWLAVASHARALFAAGAPRSWDRESCFHALSFQYTLPDRTFFAGVRQVPPGHCLCVERGQVSLHRYWDCDFPREVDERGGDDEATEHERAERFATELRTAVRLRLPADVPLACQLSGGVDSSTVLALAAEAGRALPAFTVSFPGDPYDERAIADSTAAHCGVDLHVVEATPERLLAAFDEAVWHGEGWGVNAHLPAKYLLHQAMRAAGFKACLTGEGADELLAGYPHLRIDALRAAGNERACEAIAGAHGASKGIMLAAGEGLPLAGVQGRLGFVPAFLAAKASLGGRLRGLLADDFIAEFQGRDPLAELLDACDLSQLRGRSHLRQSTWLWNKTALAAYILRTLGDGQEMSHGVEGRVPFLDHHLFELVRRLPSASLIRADVEKPLLRAVAGPLLPRSVQARPKHPFVAPPLAGRDGRLLGEIRERLAAAALSRAPFLDPAKVAGFLDRFSELSPAERSVHDPLVATVLSAAAMGRQFEV